MRFAFAIATLVLAGVLLLLGIGQRTFLAGPTETVYSAPLESESGYAVVPAAAFAAHAGNPEIVVTGQGAFAAVGSTRDVEAWLAPVSYTEFEAVRAERQLVATEKPARGDVASPSDSAQAADGSEQAEAERLPPDPRGSDLWWGERSLDEAAQPEGGTPNGSGTVRLPVPSLDDDALVIVAVEPSGSQPAEVSISWVRDLRTPWAGPLLVSGGILAVIGLVLYILAVDHDRRGLGPRRGRRGPLLGIRDSFSRGRSTRAPAAGREDSGVADRREADALPAHGRRRPRGILPAAALVGALALGGCSQNYWPEFGGEPESEPSEIGEASAIAPVPVTPEQIDHIVADVARVAGAADDALDADLLSERFTGDALRQRTSNYTIRQSVPDYAVVPPRLTDEALGYELVQSTEGWPRTIFVTVASASPSGDAGETPDTAAPSVAMTLTQQSPYENFLVSRVVALRGSITMPEAAPAEEGTALLADDLQTLMLPPGEVGAAYAAILAGGPGAAEAGLFNLEGDALVERTGAAWVAQSQATADAAGQSVAYSVSVAPTDTPIVSLSTGLGGALVAVTVREDRIEEPSSGRWKPIPPASVTALSGLSGAQDRLVSEIEHQLLFFVPGKSSPGSIQLLGSASNLVGARN